MNICLQPIGVIHTPFKDPEGMPIQPVGAAGVKGTIEVYAEYRPGLKDLAGFSHVVLLYLFPRSQGFSLQLIPFMDTETRGVFATRAPRRPNPIGLSVVQLDRIAGGIMQVQNVDILDGTPLLDIKPYVPEFDAQVHVKTGWLEKAGRPVASTKADSRFK